MIKKIICTMLCALFLLAGSVCHAASSIQVELDGVPITFDQESVIVNDRTMVPVRAIFESMGASVVWDNKTKTVTSTLDDTTVMMVINNPVMFVNGEMKTIDAPPVIVNDRTLVPVRAVSESFGCVVEWVADKRLVRITSDRYEDRLDSMKHFGSVKKLTADTISATVAFGISYFDNYHVSTYKADGTDFEITHTTDRGHITLSIRSDLYTGKEEAFTESYAKSIAEGVVEVLSGTLISSGITKFGNDNFIDIQYTSPQIVHGITDLEPELAIYIARKNGVTYTISYGVYGEVEPTVISDFRHMLQSFILA